MVAVPAAVIFVNKDLVDQVRQHIVTQLHISIAMTGTEFDQLVAADPLYVTKIKQLNMRVLVERPFTEFNNREQADVVIFVKNGLAAVESKKFGPPASTFAVINLNWGELGIFL